MTELETLTEQLLAEAMARRDARARLRMVQAMLDAMPMVATVKDASWRYVYVNAAACLRFGMPEEVWLGQRDDVLFSPEIMAETRALDAQALATGQVARAIVRGVGSADGAAADWYVTKVRFEDEDGAYFVDGVALDMTQVLRDACDLYGERKVNTASGKVNTASGKVSEGRAMADTRRRPDDGILEEILDHDPAAGTLFLRAILKAVRATENGISELNDKYDRQIANVETRLKEIDRKQDTHEKRLDWIDALLKDQRENGWRRVQMIAAYAALAISIAAMALHH